MATLMSNQPASLGVRSQQEMELAAFEKGRIQGEMEAARRMEAESLHAQKQMIPTGQDANILAQQNTLSRPDVVEINRLTWMQRLAFVLGELCNIAQLAMVIAWIEEYRGTVSWVNDSEADGDINFWNTHYLTNALGLFFYANAITNYRVAPLRTPPMLNRLWYTFLQCATIVCWSMSIASFVRATAEQEVWSVDKWVFLAAFSLYGLHALYSLFSTWMETLHLRRARANNFNNDNHNTGTHLPLTPEQRRDHSALNHNARTVYAPAPTHALTHGGHGNTNSAGSSAAHNVPAAPANAPRWAENPNTHAGDYWLLPRAKWATVAFWAMGAAILMDLAATAQSLAHNNSYWPSVGAAGGIDQDGSEMRLIGATGILTLLTLAFMSYVAMPPRTTLVKNGIMLDQTRRQSISHNAETQLGHHAV